MGSFIYWNKKCLCCGNFQSEVYEYRDLILSPFNRRKLRVQFSDQVLIFFWHGIYNCIIMQMICIVHMIGILAKTFWILYHVYTIICMNATLHKEMVWLFISMSRQDKDSFRIIELFIHHVNKLIIDNL